MQDGKPTPESPPQQPNIDWRETAAQVSQEADPQKLRELVKALCDQLDQLQSLKKPPRSDGFSSADNKQREMN